MQGNAQGSEAEFAQALASSTMELKGRKWSKFLLSTPHEAEDSKLRKAIALAALHAV